MAIRTSSGWIAEYRKKGALSLYDDSNPDSPHALLTSGKHSSGFFDSELVMEDPVLLDSAAANLVHSLVIRHLDLDHIDRVVGPAMGAITLAHDISRHIGRGRDEWRRCLRAYTEKDGERMVFKRTIVQPEERVLLCEDVLTTGKSVELSAQAVTEAGGIVLPFVAVLVNRSGLQEANGRKIAELIEHYLPIWTPEECPLCKLGSEAIRPKGVENRARFKGRYSY